MEGVQFLFIDPGFTNLGILAMKFIGEEYKIKHGNFKVDHDKNFDMDFSDVDNVVNQIVASCDEDFTLFMEANSFAHRNMQAAYGRLTAFVESTLIFKRLKNNKRPEFKVLMFDPRHYNSTLGIGALKLTPSQRKNRVNSAFMWVFNIDNDKIPYHVSDAFCCGACYILKNWKNSEVLTENERTLLEFAENFKKNVQVPQLDFIGN